MNHLLIGGKIPASEISLGCMRISSLEPKAAETLVRTALDEGIDFFDHADIYGGGRSEEVFAQAVGMCPRFGKKSKARRNAPSTTACMTFRRSTSFIQWRGASAA